MTAAQTIRYGIATVLVATLGVLAGCNGGNGGAPATASPSSTTLSDEQIMALARELGECMRNHGFPTFRDGRVENGRLLDAGPPKEPGSPREIDIPEQCVPIDERLPASAINDPPPTAAELEKMGRFAECLRQHGLPDFPDPNSDGTFAMGMTVGRALKSDMGQLAVKECQKYYDGPLREPPQ